MVWPESIVQWQEALVKELEQPMPDMKQAMTCARSLLKALEDYLEMFEGEQKQKAHYAIDDLLDGLDCYDDKNEGDACIYLRDAVDCLLDVNQ